MTYYSEDLTKMLPTEARDKGFSLTWYSPRDKDPTILYLHDKKVYEWNHDPTMGEVLDKINEVESDQRS